MTVVELVGLVLGAGALVAGGWRAVRGVLSRARAEGARDAHEQASERARRLTQAMATEDARRERVLAEVRARARAELEAKLVREPTEEDVQALIDGSKADDP